MGNHHGDDQDQDHVDSDVNDDYDDQDHDDDCNHDDYAQMMHMIIMLIMIIVLMRSNLVIWDASVVSIILHPGIE